MSERNPLRQHPEWDVPAIAKALIGAEPVPESAPSDTAGATLPVGDASLTLFPDERALEFKKETPEHTVFLRLSAAGGVVFNFTPKPPAAATGEEVMLPESIESAEPAELPEQTPSSAAKTPKKEKKERVTIIGRVEREPSFKQIKTGLMAKLPVAEHQPDGSTTWHTIVVFGKKAEALRDSLTKGQMVTIAGYPHERTISNPKTGALRTMTEIYRAGITHHK
jgi:hypothetical protein